MVLVRLGFRSMPYFCALLASVMIAHFDDAYGVAQQSEPTKVKISDQPFTDEQLGIYRLVLARWMSDEVNIRNLSDLTEPLPTDSPSGTDSCSKGLEMESAEANLVHRFRPEDAAKLGGKVRVVTDEVQEKAVDKHDPGKAIGQGKSIDEALKDGFAHGKTWFSEIHFDKSHTHAIVFYGFHCGRLCGNGGTVIMEKKHGQWKFKSQCSVWMS